MLKGSLRIRKTKTRKRFSGSLLSAVKSQRNTYLSVNTAFWKTLFQWTFSFKNGHTGAKKGITKQIQILSTRSQSLEERSEKIFSPNLGFDS